ncbi:MAG: cystathionine beta-lyase [Gammaproteobacteria bacterium]|nr:cystathionine beta-lyase [Gammaproteobacteria bacterium]
MKNDTKLIHLGRGEPGQEGTVNLPIHRASTIVYSNVASYLSRFDGERRYRAITYGANGTHNARALADAVSELEGGYGTVVTGTGLSAITMTLAALTRSGDHILVTDSVYGPTRKFCDTVLTRYRVETTYYPPAADISGLLRPNTKLVFTEAPGSLTFEMQDIPAITESVHAHGALVVMDNTWGTPLFFKPIEHGVDVSIQAGTKYIAGHSDLVIGMITADDEAIYRQLFDATRSFGDVAGPDDCYLALRGFRTLGVRLRQQQENALIVAQWLHDRDEVEQVLYPPLPSDPGHAIWQRDFAGAASVFGVTLKTADSSAIEAMVNHLGLFQIGSSWGGYESLVAVNKTPLERAHVHWDHVPLLLRLHVGLEDPGDLIADLEAGFERLNGKS